MKNAISWFEIPTTDIDRAQKFYETIFNLKKNITQYIELVINISK